MRAGTHDAHHRSAARRDPKPLHITCSTIWRSGTADGTVDTGVLFTPGISLWYSTRGHLVVMDMDAEVAVGASAEVVHVRAM